MRELRDEDADDNDDIAETVEHGPEQQDELGNVRLLTFPTRARDSQRAWMFNARFEQGRRNTEEHMNRMLTTRDLTGCPCMSCAARRGR